MLRTQGLRSGCKRKRQERRRDFWTKIQGSLDKAAHIPPLLGPLGLHLDVHAHTPIPGPRPRPRQRIVTDNTWGEGGKSCLFFFAFLFFFFILSRFVQNDDKTVDSPCCQSEPSSPPRRGVGRPDILTSDDAKSHDRPLMRDIRL